MLGGRKSSSDSADTDEETDRQVAAGTMNASMANPDRRHPEEGGESRRGGSSGQEEEEEEDSGAEERK